jgi:hypothetical protein
MPAASAKAAAASRLAVAGRGERPVHMPRSIAAASVPSAGTAQTAAGQVVGEASMSTDPITSAANSEAKVTASAPPNDATTRYGPGSPAVASSEWAQVAWVVKVTVAVAGSLVCRAESLVRAHPCPVGDGRFDKPSVGARVQPRAAARWYRPGPRSAGASARAPTSSSIVAVGRGGRCCGGGRSAAVVVAVAVAVVADEPSPPRGGREQRRRRWRGQAAHARSVGAGVGSELVDSGVHRCHDPLGSGTASVAPPQIHAILSGTMHQRLPIPDFVGRRVELAVFERAIEDARRGLPSVVLVSGDAGIGKTTIVSESASRADADIYVGRSTHIGGDTIPLAPLADLLRQVRARNPSCSRGTRRWRCCTIGRPRGAPAVEGVARRGCSSPCSNCSPPAADDAVVVGGFETCTGPAR